MKEINYAKNPSFFQIFVAQSQVFLYFEASKPCKKTRK